MKINHIFAENLFAIQFPGEELDEYELAIDNWNDISYLHKFHKENENWVTQPYFPDTTLNGFVQFITENVFELEDKLKEAADSKQITDVFELLHNVGKVYSELLPKRKAKQRVLRLYGIQLEEIVIIAGSAIKLSDEMDKHPLTKEQLLKIDKLQFFLLENSIHDEESFFDYLNENNDD